MYQNFLLNNHGIFFVNAEPLEQSRLEVTEEKIRTNATEMAQKIAQADPRFVFNADETSVDATKETKKKKVFSLHDCPTTYISDRSPSHITFLSTIGVNGCKLPTLVIINTKTIVSELSVRFGFPQMEHAHVVSSTSGYINEELFVYWVDKILKPGIEARRRALEAPDAKALILLDGCLAHSKDVLEKVSIGGISYHYFVPHSSHLSQPLDRGIFSYYKRIYAAKKIAEIKNVVAKRIIKGLEALDEVTTFRRCRASFWRAGIELNYEENKPKITVNIQAILSQRNSPNTATKEAAFVDKKLMKRKRTDTGKFGFTKEEKLKRKKKDEESHATKDEKPSQ